MYCKLYAVYCLLYSLQSDENDSVGGMIYLVSPKIYSLISFSSKQNEITVECFTKFKQTIGFVV